MTPTETAFADLARVVGAMSLALTRARVSRSLLREWIVIVRRAADALEKIVEG